MLVNIQIILFTFAALFPVLNPLSGMMIFLNLTQGAPKSSLNKLALKVGINTFILLTIVLLTGSWMLSFFGITIPIVQVGGGFVVASFAWTLLNQPVLKPNENASLENDRSINDMAFFPLTMPLTAGPGCIAVTLTIGAHEMHKKLIETTMGEAGAVIGIFFAALSVWICYRYAKNITLKLGDAGTRVIMKLAAFINMCIGLQIVWDGVRGLLLGIL